MEMNTYSPSKFLNKPSKRNRFYLNNCDDDNELEDLCTLKRKSTNNNDEKIKINNLANRLRTLLKLPKAHRWVIYEWFYSNLDQPLFCYNKPNDFQLCLNDIFPQLKTRNLRRTEWCQIRKLMGKPRRCSAAFLEEERETLKRRREKLREIYLNSNIDNLNDYQDLPDTISLPLIIGSKCTVLYKKTHDGLFDGTINAIDLKNGTYRVSFDKPGFGYENVFDFEIRSIQPTELMPLVAFESKKNRPTSSSSNSSNVKKLYGQQKLNEIIDEQYIKEENDNSTDLPNEMSSIASDESFVRFMNHCTLNSQTTNSTNSTGNYNSINSTFNSTTNQLTQQQSNLDSSACSPSINAMSGLINSSSFNSTNHSNNERMIGNYPLKFLASIISFYKLVNKKTAKLNELKTMNTQAEFHKSGKTGKLSNEFRNEYATIVLDLEKIKDSLNLNLEHLEQYCKELKLSPKQMNKNGNTLEKEIVKRNLMNTKLNTNSTDLITNLIGLLLMLKDSDDASSLQVKLKSIKQTLNHRNIPCFENNVEVHLNHLQFNYNLDKITNSRLDF